VQTPESVQLPLLGKWKRAGQNMLDLLCPVYALTPVQGRFSGQQWSFSMLFMPFMVEADRTQPTMKDMKSMKAADAVSFRCGWETDNRFLTG